MQYPLISEYIESILDAEYNFDTLNNLRPVLDDEDHPIMSSGNFAVVFKMTDGGKFFAVKCFTRDQVGREKAYKRICAALKDLESPYLVQFSYHEAELFVDSMQSDDTEFPVVLMEWVDGMTLDKYINKFQGNPFALYELCYNFRNMAKWLVSQHFAHGDIKPDNILIREDGRIALIDYDGMYVRSMRDEVQREDGTPDYRNPFFISEFNEHMDDYALAILSLSLKIISASYHIKDKYQTNGNGLIISNEDVLNLNQSGIFSYIRSILTSEPNLPIYYATFIKCLGGHHLTESDFIITAEKTVNDILQFWPSNLFIPTSDKIKRGELDSNGVIYTKDGTGVIGIVSEKIPDDREIYIKEGVIFFYEDSMSYDTPKLKLHLPSTLRYFNARSLDYKYDSIEWASPWYKYLNGIIYTQDETEAILKHLVDAQISPNTLILGEHLFNGLKFDGVLPNSILRIRNSVFENAQVPDIFRIPEGIISIGNRALAHCSAKKIVLPKTLNHIGIYCFHMCPNLECIDFNLDSKLETIRECACVNNKSLCTIIFPSKLKCIGKSAFQWCYKIKAIAFPPSLEEIEDNAFQMNGFFMDEDKETADLTELVFPSSLKRLGVNAFSNCKNLSNVTFTSSIEKIGDSAFEGCSSLKTLNHQGIKHIGKCAFLGCDILFESLEDIEYIEPGAVTGCRIGGIKNSSYFVKRDCLYSDAHQLIYCWSNESIIEIEEGVSDIDSNAFLRKPIALILPHSYITDNLEHASFVSVLVVPKHVSAEKYYDETRIFHAKVFVDTQGVIYSDDRKSLVLFPRELGLEKYRVIDGCEIIKENAFELAVDPDPEFGVFYYGNKLKEIILPQSLRIIEDGAFSGCQKITSLEIPENVIAIGSRAFQKCTNLAKIVLPSSLECLGGSAFDPSVKVIIPPNGPLRYEGKCLLSKDNKLLWIPEEIDALRLPEIVSYMDKRCRVYNNCLVTLEGELIWTIPNIPTFEFPSSVVRIGRQAFFGNKVIKELVIPEGVTSIDYYAFGYNQALEDIYLPSTMRNIDNLKTRQGWGRKYIEFFYPKRVHIPKGMRNHFKKLLPDIPDSKLIEY